MEGLPERLLRIPAGYSITNDEIRVVLELLDKAKRADVGASLEIAYSRGTISKKMPTEGTVSLIGGTPRRSSAAWQSGGFPSSTAHDDHATGRAEVRPAEGDRGRTAGREVIHSRSRRKPPDEDEEARTKGRTARGVLLGHLGGVRIRRVRVGVVGPR